MLWLLCFQNYLIDKKITELYNKIMIIEVVDTVTNKKYYGNNVKSVTRLNGGLLITYNDDYVQTLDSDRYNYYVTDENKNY